MRWDHLFDDLEAALDAQSAADRLDEVAERTRAERAAVGLGDRLRAQRGELELTLRDGSHVRGTVLDAAPTWLLLADGRREHLAPVAAVAVVAGLSDAVAGQAGEVLSRLGLAHALRGIAQDRSVVVARVAGLDLVGRVDAVGVDHLVLAEAGPDGRPTGRRRAVATASLDLLTRRE